MIDVMKGAMQPAAPFLADAEALCDFIQIKNSGVQKALTALREQVKVILNSVSKDAPLLHGIPERLRILGMNEEANLASSHPEQPAY